jgi:pimeloyl-ACP methyl ester carboxylesterase
MSAIVCNSEIVHFEVLGRGKPVLFLHGWAGSWRYWVPTMQAVSYGYRAYALDLWGFGDTEKARDFYSLEHQAELVEDFLRELGVIGKVAIVAHGLGALVAVQFALNNPKRVARMMLSNCPLNGAYSNRLFSETPEALVDWLMPEHNSKPSTRTEAEKADAEALRRPLMDFHTLSLEDELFKSELETVMLYSRNDPLVPVPTELLPESMPESMQSFVFEESGHFPMLDQDHQYNRLLREFLEMERGASPRTLTLKEQWIRRVR